MTAMDKEKKVERTMAQVVAWAEIKDAEVASERAEQRLNKARRRFSELMGATS